jgi:peroxiredoxin
VSESRLSNIKTGTKVGERIPEFSMRLTDGSTLTSEDLVTEGKPVFLYFFATW